MPEGPEPPRHSLRLLRQALTATADAAYVCVLELLEIFDYGRFRYGCDLFVIDT